MPVKRPTFEEYQLNVDERTIELTMEAAEVSREEAIMGLKKLYYKADYPSKKVKKKKRKTTSKKT